MTKKDQQNSVDWTKDHMSWKFKYERISSDENKFNLNVPDGWYYYWQNLRKVPNIFLKQQQGGGLLMVWAASVFGDKGNVVFPLAD